MWIDFLTHIADTAFSIEKGKINQEKSPSELLTNLLDLIDLQLKDHPSKKDIESAVNAFANHEEVKKVWET